MSAEFMAGAGRAVVDLQPSAFPLDGFTAQRDSLHVRALLLASGEDRLAVVIVEQVSLTGPLVKEIAEATCAAAQVSADRVLVGATHTFAAPHILPSGREHAGEERQTQVAKAATLEAVRASVSAAHAGLVPAKVGSGTGQSAVNVNRDMLTRDGWWIGHDDSGLSDHNVEVLRIDALSGAPIAVLSNYPVQSAIMHESLAADGGKLVSGDLAGAAMLHVERQYDDDVVALFLIGAAGDQSPRLTSNRYVIDRDGSWSRVDIHEAGFVLVDLLGEQLGTEVVRVCETIDTIDTDPQLKVSHMTLDLPGQLPPKNFRELMPTLDYEYVPDGTTSAPVMLASVGDTAIVAVQVALSASTGAAIKQCSPFPQTLVMTLANGNAKYMAARAAYDRGTYASMNTSFARGAAEALTESVAEELTALSGSDNTPAAVSGGASTSPDRTIGG